MGVNGGQHGSKRTSCLARSKLSVLRRALPLSSSAPWSDSAITTVHDSAQKAIETMR